MIKNRKPLKIGIIGCGLIGRKRANAISKNESLLYCSDINLEIGEKFSKDFNIEFIRNWKNLVRIQEIDLIIIATNHKSLAEITEFCIINDKHVFVEKPGSRNIKEIKKLISINEQNNKKIHVFLTLQHGL